jgi:7-carboxy-7-deazaguanine synthase (Cx14CxxC type)
MTYSVKELFYTLQGEGLRAGRPAVFCRFAGCNLWSGRAEDRAQAVCRFCDTDFVGTDGTFGGKYTAQELAQKIAGLWPCDVHHLPSGVRPYVVLTGGEPMLQVDSDLLDALHAQHFEVAIETNGTLPVPILPAAVDWICVSPKAGAPWVQTQGHELKLVFPQPSLMPGDVEALADEQAIDFDYWLLQPMDGPDQVANTQAAIAYCQAHPRWRLSVQTHKILQIR